MTTDPVKFMQQDRDCALRVWSRKWRICDPGKLELQVTYCCAYIYIIIIINVGSYLVIFVRALSHLLRDQSTDLGFYISYTYPTTDYPE